MPALDGIVVIDKPGGVTSAAVVARVKRALRVKRVGHTGTLDPMATGVLPLCLGEATKVAGYLLAEDKTYEATLALGVETDTLDADGQVVRRAPEAAAEVTEVALRSALDGFLGPGTQVPPMYSALRHKGKRLYELARAGEEVERPPRAIHIHELALLSFAPSSNDIDGPETCPEVRIRVHCSKGTYVRTLAADLGQRLGCGAHLTALRRLQSGRFRIEDAVEPSGITKDSVQERLIPAAAALAHLAAVEVPEALLGRVHNGLVMRWTRFVEERPPPAQGEVIRLLTPAGRLLALAQVDAQGQVRYRRVFKAMGHPT